MSKKAKQRYVSKKLLVEENSLNIQVKDLKKTKHIKNHVHSEGQLKGDYNPHPRKDKTGRNSISLRKVS